MLSRRAVNHGGTWNSTQPSLPAAASGTRALACISQARHDVALLVELLVQRGGGDGHVGMRGAEGCDALGGGHHAGEAHRGRAGLLRGCGADNQPGGGENHRHEAEAVGESTSVVPVLTVALPISSLSG